MRPAHDLWGIDLTVKLADHTKDPSDTERKEDIEEGDNDSTA